MNPYLLVLVSLLLSAPLGAEPGPDIGRMMQTPASAFDLFLLRIHESAKCNQVVKNNNVSEADLCLSSLAYDPEANLLTVYFRVQPFAEAMDDFVDQDAPEREQILLRLLDNTARRFGAIGTWGLLHNLPLGFAASAAGVDDKAFRSELAARTRVVLTTSHDGRVHVASRAPGGKVEYATRP